MNQQIKKLSVSGLQWTLGLVVLLESVHFTLSPSAGHQFAKTGLPHWIRPALGGSEVVAALIVIHFLVGEIAGVGSLVVYSMAVIVCMAHRNRSSGGVA